MTIGQNWLKMFTMISEKNKLVVLLIKLFIFLMVIFVSLYLWKLGLLTHLVSEYFNYIWKPGQWLTGQDKVTAQCKGEVRVDDECVLASSKFLSYYITSVKMSTLKWIESMTVFSPQKAKKNIFRLLYLKVNNCVCFNFYQMCMTLNNLEHVCQCVLSVPEDFGFVRAR